MKANDVERILLNMVATRKKGVLLVGGPQNVRPQSSWTEWSERRVSWLGEVGIGADMRLWS